MSNTEPKKPLTQPAKLQQGASPAAKSNHLFGPVVRPKGDAVRDLRLSEGLTQQAIASELGYGRITQWRMEQGERCLWEYLDNFAQFMKVPIGELIDQSIAEAGHHILREWSVKNGTPLADWTTLPNGLRMRPYEMLSGTVPDRRARGKLYDLTKLADDAQEIVREKLIRHTFVCEQVRSPHIVRAYLSESDSEPRFWWVIDEWIDGKTLEFLLRKDRKHIDTPRVAREILVALQALHSADIIRRALTPCSVIIRDSDGTVLLTDFELAKLLATDRPTVQPSKGLLNSTYLAPEVLHGGREIHSQADLFSWAIIVSEMLTGKSPPDDSPPDVYFADLLSSQDIPSKIKGKLRACLATHWKDRPDSASSVLRVLMSWT